MKPANADMKTKTRRGKGLIGLVIVLIWGGVLVQWAFGVFF